MNGKDITVSAQNALVTAWHDTGHDDTRIRVIIDRVVFKTQVNGWVGDHGLYELVIAQIPFDGPVILDPRF